jgi:predicted secreted Zn-dependent protease
MKRIFTCLAVCFLYGRAFPQDIIVWSGDTKLTWADFTGKADSGSPFVAVTVSGIQYKFRSDSRGMSDSVFAVFYKAESWVKGSTATTLAHEQGHFDITEVYARRMRKRLEEFVPRRGSLARQLESLYEEVERERDVEEDLYDRQTGHGSFAVRQTEWAARIQKELKEMEGFGL